jgi:hypothetical protein
VGNPVVHDNVFRFTPTDPAPLSEDRVREIVRDELIRSGLLVDKGGEQCPR